MIIVRDIVDEDFTYIGDWFKNRKWPMPPVKGILPKTGYVAEHNGNPVAVGWVYLTNSSMAFIEWTATNPKSGIIGLRGIKKIVDHIKALTEGNYEIFMQFVPSKKFAKYMETKMGFKKSEEATLMISTRRR